MLVSNSRDHSKPVHIDPESLNILISCQTKARALHAVFRVEKLCRKSCAGDLNRAAAQDNPQTPRIQPAKLSCPQKDAWLRSSLNLSVPTSRFAKLFGSSAPKEAEVRQTRTGDEKRKESKPLPETRQGMIFFPHSHDLKRLIGLLIDHGEKSKAIEILERHILLYRRMHTMQGPRASPFWNAAKTDLHDIDEAVCLVSPLYFEKNDIDGITAVVVSSGCLPISSSMLISKLEEKRMTSRVNLLLECMNEKTRLAITSTYSALIATWAAKRR